MDHVWVNRGMHGLQARIDGAIAGADPVLCNLRITLAHEELSLALREITGADSGANFHTWAVWGSKKAGRTIRQEDLPLLPRAAWAVGALAGAGGGATEARARPGRHVGLPVAAGTAAGAALSRTARALLARAASQIFAGNVTVLTDIGRQTARFVGAFADRGPGDEDRLEDFLAALRPGSAYTGGQDLLRGAYRHYFCAGRENDRDRRDEHMLCANLLAILHEHERLEPYIQASIPRPLRGFVTKHLLGFAVGDEAMKVSSDVIPRTPTPFPDTLRTIESPELEAFLCGPDGWDRTPDSTRGSAAHDWTKLADRMNFIVDLFRTRQTDPNLFSPPFTALQREAIVAGRIPAGPL
ncbi:MAG: hypothetical protein QOK31_418 [Solirubrobacteraceae bacterium]|jgi:hypothetical protein|nr:hypothetical protein [Solirubrobacteraceae bacterium]